MQLTPVKIIRYAPWAILGLLLWQLFFMIVSTFYADRAISFHAQTSDNFREKTRNEVLLLDENKFTTGVEGEVTWKAKSFKEAFVLSNVVVESKAILSALDVIWYFIFDCILFWMVYDIKAENFFSKRVMAGVMVIWFFLIFSSWKGAIYKEVADYFLSDITQGQFEVVHQNPQMSFLIFLFPVLLHFLQKGQKSEEEQNLTI